MEGTLDRWSAVVKLTRYTHSATAALLLVAAYLQQLRHGEGLYFAWAEKEISGQAGIKRRAILTARRLLRRLRLMDWDAPSGRRAVYLVNTDLVAEIVGVCPSPDGAPAGISDSARTEPGPVLDMPAEVGEPARNAIGADVNAPAQRGDPARNGASEAPASERDPARSGGGAADEPPAEVSNPARSVLVTSPETPAEAPNPAPPAPPEPPHTPLGTNTRAFSTKQTRYAGAAPAQAPQDAGKRETTDPAGDTPGAALLKRCGLTAKQISAAAARYTSEQITQAVDRVRALRRQGRCQKPVAMLAHLLKTGDWPAPIDTSAFDEPPISTYRPSYAGQPAPPSGRVVLPRPERWQTLQDRSAQIGAYLDSLPPLPAGFFGFTSGGRDAIEGRGRAALCAGS